MNRLELLTATGSIALNGIKILPLSLADFLSAVDDVIVSEDDLPLDLGLSGYTIEPVKFINYAFELKVRFKDGLLKYASLAWEGGVTELKGWDSVLSDLIADKNMLSRRFAKAFNVRRDKISDDQDCFRFDWGIIEVNPVKLAMYVKMDIWWRPSAR